MAVQIFIKCLLLLHVNMGMGFFKIARGVYFLGLLHNERLSVADQINIYVHKYSSYIAI